MKENKISDISFKLTKEFQSRDIEAYNKQSHMLMLCKLVASKYVLEHNQASPRVKNNKNTSELLGGKSTILNVYPAESKTVIEGFLVKYPLDTWCGNYTDGVFELIEEGENEGKYRCLICGDAILRKSSRSSHKSRTKKHLALVLLAENSATSPT